MKILIAGTLYLVLAPFIGAFLAGIDRKISARMQGRVGPPIRQPLYDVTKLFQKENLVVRRSQNFYIFYYLLFTIFTGGLFFTGQNLLLAVFALALASVFFVLAGFKASSPYSFIGAQRELIQISSYEPAVLLVAVGMYMVTKTFDVGGIAGSDKWLILYLPGIFLSFLYILAIKLRKSPFDLSTSHHAHQELIKGITTEFSGRTLALIEIAHWYETVFVLGVVYLFFAKNIFVAIAMSVVVYFFMVFEDNAFARVKWQLTVASSWAVAFVLGFGNIVWLFIVRGTH
jgi:ech hydrogenase subunit B